MQPCRGLSCLSLRLCVLVGYMRSSHPRIHSRMRGRGNQRAGSVRSGKTVCDLSLQAPEYISNLGISIISDFEVKYPLPNLTNFALPRSFAGNIPVNRAGHPNDTLFFWAFERHGSNGTLTTPAHESNTEPWIIWLQGGCVIFRFAFHQIIFSNSVLHQPRLFWDAWTVY